jgi:phosphotransferase family enzyme
VDRNGAARIRRAVSAVRSVAHQYRIPCNRLRVLHHANNVVLHLAPSPVVAKVSLSAGAAAWEKLAAEVAIGRHLAQAGAPVVGPYSDVPPGPHASGDCAITFWRYHDHDPGAAACGRLAAEVLEQVQHALEDFPGPTQSFLERRVRCTGHVLAQDPSRTALPARDRDFLRDEYTSILSTLGDHNILHRNLHGDPHRGNFLVSPSGYRLIDFESVCSGPREWDLSALPGDGAACVSAVDEELLLLLCRLRSVCVAVWCGMRSARSGAMQNAARTHLELLRNAA